ncbi:MAG TPA: alpha/beta hydrolase [Bryobacteraceae bacterium]|jgi:pimeloyl-ACP methyl ester carboxylesterase|nr:alpha/beta hydrolase [Bryobacteraceae bacterium]
MARLLLILVLLTSCLNAQTSELADAWRSGGQYFSWQASAANGAKSLQIFYTCMGDEGKPAILLLHGFPTSSFDYADLSRELKSDFRICTFDFPGYGFSDKPASGYRYTLRDDADLTRYFLKDIAKFSDFTLYSHDRGDSVALNLLQLAQLSDPFKVTRMFITNGNIYLPLANLTDFQKRALNPATSAASVRNMTPQLLAGGMGATTFTPALKPDDPEVKALAANFTWQDGVQVIPETIKYLNERAQFEVSFLEGLARTSFPVTLIWGVHDMVSPVRVAEYVWEHYLQTRPASGAFWIAPCGNHYVQHDQPQAIAQIMRAALSGKRQAAPLNLSGDVCAPVLAGTTP